MFMKTALNEHPTNKMINKIKNKISKIKKINSQYTDYKPIDM